MTSPISFFAAFGFGAQELLVILLILLVLFGGSKLPSLARGLGQSVKEFKKASKEEDDVKPTTAEEAKKSEPAKTPGSN